MTETITQGNPPKTVAILALPEVGVSTVYGMFDMFMSAGRDWGMIVDGRPGESVIVPRVRLWRTRGVLAFGCYMAISSYLPFLWAEWLAPIQLFDLSGLSTFAGAVIGVLAYEAGVWIWHRGLHGSGTLWRYLHQWHHSAERLDTWGAFWFSPLDMVGWTALFSLALTLVGLSPSAVFATVCFTTFLSVFQHANVHTPRWLGVFVQRPESHSWHHARGVHAGNYSDLPLFDILLGTWKNPRDYAPQ